MTWVTIAQILVRLRRYRLGIDQAEHCSSLLARGKRFSLRLLGVGHACALMFAMILIAAHRRVRSGFFGSRSAAPATRSGSQSTRLSRQRLPYFISLWR